MNAWMRFLSFLITPKCQIHQSYVTCRPITSFRTTSKDRKQMFYYFLLLMSNVNFSEPGAIISNIWHTCCLPSAFTLDLQDDQYYCFANVFLSQNTGLQYMCVCGCKLVLFASTIYLRIGTCFHSNKFTVHSRFTLVSMYVVFSGNFRFSLGTFQFLSKFVRIRTFLCTLINPI